MSFDIGIIGLPNAGKSTLFNLLTEAQAEVDSYPFTTIDPTEGVVKVDDERLEEIEKIVNPKKKLKPTLKFIDIAGLIEGAHKGEGLGNEFLSHVRGCDGLLHVIRAFEKDEPPTPKKDKGTIENELIMKDLEVAENLLEKTKQKEKREILEKIKNNLEEERSLKFDLSDEEKELIKEFQFLSLKPVLTFYNGNRENGLSIDLKMEEEIKELSEKEKGELDMSSRLNELLKACRETFSLITFFTIAEGKAQGWTIPQGMTVRKAGGRIHSDFEEKFKRAEVTNLEGLKNAGSFEKARREGKVKTVGEDYTVKDGDIIEYKI